MTVPDGAPEADEHPGDGGRSVRIWPQGQSLAEADARAATCASCAQPWRVHKSLCGFRLRCDCGAWVDIPKDTQSTPALLTSADPAHAMTPSERTALRKAVERDHAALQPLHRDERGMVQLRVGQGEVADVAIPTSLPMAPGTLQQSKVEWRARWTSVALLEITAVLFAILAPQLAAMAMAEGQEGALLLPFASLLGGLAVLAIAAFSGPYGTVGLRRFSGAHALEAAVAPWVGFALAFFWCKALFAAVPDLEGDPSMRELVDRLGPELSVFTIAVMPAIVEEIAFRGMLQGRLMALLGARQGFLVTAFAFMFVHLSPLTMPIHLGLGLYLGWLRERSGSLWPGIFVHFAYNTCVVLLFPD
jgi:hypothetical protein